MARNKRREPRQARSIEKVERILEAARELLSREGPDAFNTNRIAVEAGLSVGSIYEYFPNKQAIIARLIEELAETEGRAVLARLDELGDAPLEDVIDGVVPLTCELYDRNRALYRLLWSMSGQAPEVGSRPLEQAIVGEMQARLSRRAKELDIDDVELACFTAFHLVESLAARMSEQGRAWASEVRAAEIARAVKRYLGLPA